MPAREAVHRARAATQGVAFVELRKGQRVRAPRGPPRWAARDRRSRHHSDEHVRPGLDARGPRGAARSPGGRRRPALPQVAIPSPCRTSEYEQRFSTVLRAAREDGITHLVFGDLFLADIRAYRERLLAPLGHRAGVPAVAPRHAPARTRHGRRRPARSSHLYRSARLAPSFAGREFEGRLLDDLPASVDPCGENGEFHTFVTHGPMFDRPVDVASGEVVERDGFVFADLLPA